MVSGGQQQPPGADLSDSVAATPTPVYISASKFCRSTRLPPILNYLQCTGSGAPRSGINASYTGTPGRRPGAASHFSANDFQGKHQ